MRAGSAGTLAALLLALACSSAAAPSATGAPPYTGRIVFDAGISDPPGDIFTMNADGTHLRRLTRNDHGEYAPRWSPDGGRIAFVREIFRKRVDVYIMNADGTGVHRLAPRRLFSADPDWSPDGRRIVFTSLPGLGSPQVEIHVIDADGTNEHQLFRHANSPAWSPDGRRIAFVRMPRPTKSNDSWIYVASADGSGAKRIAAHFSGDPAWSPDGTRIAFSSYRTGSGDIYVMRPNGNAVRRLTRGGNVDHHPVWSPDGKRIAFSRFGVAYGVFVVNVATKRVRQLTPAYLDGAGNPDWIGPAKPGL